MLILIRHGLSKGCHVTFGQPRREVNQFLYDCFTRVGLTIAVGIFFAQGDAKHPQPAIVTSRFACPERAGVFLVARLVASRGTESMVDGRQHLGCLKRHLDNMLIAVPHSCNDWFGV